MSRPPKIRKIYFSPDITYFKPQGIPLRKLEEVNLSFDELEAVRLSNYEKIDQVQSAKKMKISQSTFQRILSKANYKIAEALIRGKAIKIEGGKYKIANLCLRKGWKI